ncbi:Cd2+/Zn2+-exporting ATPase [Gracilibacillus ureilyticus]|uniref:Cd(2+)-exporting ATPase n=1 Tax=Gracilibacillus ureilyticus TaxID=531814 RepID=A0A1H9LH41_9BACI|nr:Cd2+/Zn2+-exporting ATPase [Gracilibacillus ureilyticus]
MLIFALLSHISGFYGLRQGILLAASIVAGIPIFTKAFQALHLRVFSIELLVTLAVTGALFIGEYVESAVVTFLFLFGDYLETRTLQKTRSSLKELFDMAPQEATVVREGIQMILPAENVNRGDHIIIRSGGKVPVDGEIISGQAALYEAAVTGESVPVLKKKGDKVFSGTVVDNGYIEMFAEKVGDDTTFSRIMELVEEAQDSKTKTEKFLNKFANVYTPAVVMLSVLVYIFTRDLHKAITFLVIACPGALVIGAPVSNVAGIGNGAKNGVLVKGGEVIEKFAKVDTLVFDKTGTLTKGKPEVTNIYTIGTQNENELLRLVAQAEMISEHHLGRTIVKEAKIRKLKLGEKPEDGVVIKGNGLRANVEGHAVAIGNRKLMNAEHIHIPNEAQSVATEREKFGNIAIFVAIDGELSGIISVADQIREDALTALKEMRRNGIKKMIMLTGDNQHTAELVADQLDLDEYYAELLPENKVDYVKKLKEEGRIVAMAGDGINDAPAIALLMSGSRWVKAEQMFQWKQQMSS